jgi:hypothetical protein
MRQLQKNWRRDILKYLAEWGYLDEGCRILYREKQTEETFVAIVRGYRLKISSEASFLQYVITYYNDGKKVRYVSCQSSRLMPFNDNSPLPED